MRANSLVYRMGTHKTQHKPKDVVEEALDYMNIMRPFLKGPHRDQRFILNMDHPPVFFCMMRKKTIEVIGVKTVHIHASTNDTKRAPVAVTIAADGTVLPLRIVFKGKPDGRIARSEFATYPTTHHYRCQDNAWLDERVMMEWVDNVLKPYVANAPDHVIPLLILESYRCHMMASVVTRIQELGIEVKHVPGGCTSLCLPVDVGFNKQFKDRVRRQWMSRMISEGIIHGTTSSPQRRNVAGWVNWAMTEMKEEVGIICKRRRATKGLRRMGGWQRV
jgi:hypothetical protein